MAQENNSFQENILINTKQVGTEQVERVLSKLLATIEALPDAARASQGPVRQLIELLKGVKVESLGSKEGLGQIKAIQAAMGSLKTLASATKLFENSDLQAAQEQLKLLKQIEAQYARINREKQLESGTYGFRTNNVRDAQKQLQELQRYASTTAPAKQSAGLMTEGGMFKLEQNMKLLQTRIRALQMGGLQEQALRENIAYDKAIERRLTKAQEAAQKEDVIRDKAAERNRRRIDQGRQYELYSAQGKGQLLQQVEERQMELRRRRLGQDQEYKLYAAQSAGNLLNETGLRQLQYRAIQNANAQQFQMYNLNPNKVLADAFRAHDMAPQGLGRLQAINRDADPKVQAQQQAILDIQKQLIARTKEGNLLDGERLGYLNRMLDAKKKEKDITKEVGDVSARQVATERQLARVRGEAGAALATVQAALMLNYAIIGNVVGAFKSAVTTAVEYEAALKNVQAVTATSAADMADLDKQIRSVASASRFSSIEVANAALTLGQAGLSAKQIGETLQAVTTLANASGSNLGQAVDLLTSVLGVFDKHGSDAVDVVNKITQATNDSKLTVDRLALAFQYVGNTAAQANISFEETTAALAAMSNAGIRSGSTMGTGLRQFLVEVQKPSEDFVKSIRSVGLSMDDLDFKANGFLGVVKKLRESGFQASDAIRSFDVRGAAAFNAMLANPQAMEIEYERMLQSTAAMDANKTQMESLKAQAARLQTSLGNLVIEGMNPVLFVLGGIASKMADVAQAASDLGPVIGVLGAIIASALGVRAVMYVSDLVQGFIRLSGTGSMVAKSMEGIATIAGVTTTRVQAATVAMTGFEVSARAASIATGIGLVAAIGSLIYMGVTMWAEQSAKKIDDLKAAFDRAKGGVQEKEEAIKSLSVKIEELMAREEKLTTDQQALKNEVDDVNTRFGKWGLTLDSGNTKLKDLVQEVRNLRSELRQLALDDMNLSVAKARELSEAKTKEATSKFKNEFRAFHTGGNIDPNADTNLNNLNSLLRGPNVEALRKAGMQDRQLKMLQDFAAVANNANSTPEDLRYAGSVANMLGSLDKKKLSSSLADTVAKTAEAVLKQAGYVSAANSARMDVRQQEAKLDFDTRLSEAGKGIQFKGQSLEDFLAGMRANSPVASARKALGGNTDAVALQDKTKDIVFNNVQLLKDASDALEKSNDVKSDVREKLQADLQAEIRRQQTVVRENANYAMEDVKVMSVVQKAKEGAELRHMQSNFTLGLVDKSSYERGREIIKNQQNQKFLEETLSLNKGTKDYDNKKFAILGEDRGGELYDRLAQWDRDYREALKLVQQNALKQEEANLKAAAQKAIAQAKAERSKASSFNTPDEIMNMMNSGLAFLTSARDNELSAHRTRVSRERVKADKNALPQMEASWAEQEEAITDRWAAQFNTFAQSFTEVFTKSTKRLYDLTRKIAARQVELELAERAAEDRLYEGDAQLRGNRVGIARATGPVSSRGVSETEAYLLQRRNESTVLDSLQRSRAEKEGLLGLSQTDMGTYAADRASSLAAKQQAEAAATAFLNGRDPDELAGVDDTIYKGLKQKIETTGDSAKKAADAYDKAAGKVKSLRKEIQSLDEEIAGQTPIIPDLLQGSDLIDAARISWDRFMLSIEDMNPKKTLIDGLSQSLMQMTNLLGTALYNIVSRTKTVKEAFRDMAVGIVQSMLQILAQAMAMQAMKGLFKALGIGDWISNALNGGGGAAAGATLGGVNASAGTGMGVVLAATGGYFNQQGRIERVRKMANAGPIHGGVPGRDSVPVLAMPGEFMINKRAVDAVGTDFLHSLNAGVVNSAAAVAPAPRAQQSKGGGDVNVYVVTKDQVPSGLGPKDVLVTVADDITRGGSLKKLIKKVSQGEV